LDYYWLASEIDETWKAESDKQRGWNERKEDLLELDGEVKIVAAAFNDRPN
jgi:hypothetical protein